MEIEILVKSSSQSEPRSVQVIKDDSGLSFFCDCPAGERGRICKHKKSVASADDHMLYDEEQRENFEKVVDWLSQSGYPELMNELKAVGNELRAAREKESLIREKITRIMKEGMK